MDPVCFFTDLFVQSLKVLHQDGYQLMRSIVCVRVCVWCVCGGDHVKRAMTRGRREIHIQLKKSEGWGWTVGGLGVDSRRIGGGQ